MDDEGWRKEEGMMKVKRSGWKGEEVQVKEERRIGERGLLVNRRGSKCERRGEDRKK